MRIIDLDGSVTGQPPLLARVAAGNADCIEARDLASQLRIVANRSALASLSDRLRQVLADPTEPRLTFYGSGDFHHLTASLLREVDVDVTLVHFDNHPDWVKFPATSNCGAWVNRALELPHVKRVVTIGPCSDDLVRPELQFANLRGVADGRIVLYPWRHAPSRVWGRYGTGPAHRQNGGALHWQTLADADRAWFLDTLIDRIDTSAIWITVDKDVLGPSEATTNWDQGEMPLAHVMAIITRLAEHFRIAGADVCGDYSPPAFRDPFRAVLAYFDHPAMMPPTPEQLEVNVQTNVALLHCFEKVLP